MTTMRGFALWLAVCGCAAAQTPHPAWQEDLEFLVRELPAHHINLFYRMSKADFQAQAAAIAEAIPRLSEAEFRTALVRLVASAGNGHTTLNALTGAPRYPVRFEAFPEGYFATQATAPFREALGARLTSIGGIPVDEVAKRLSGLVARETALSEKANLPGYLAMEYALAGTGVLKELGPAEFGFERDGRAFPLTMPPVNVNPPVPFESALFHRPLWLQDPSKAYWFQYLEAERTLYIQYNRCQDDPSRPFADFTREAMAAADSHAVEKVVIDLRHNGGGNSAVIAPLIAALKARPKMTQQGHVFVLIGRYTYSSGFLAELELRNKLKARLVGEASAQRPNAYGEVRAFQLPRSGFTVSYPTKHFVTVMGDPDTVAPDIAVETTARDYFAGRDAVLERVFAPAGR